MSERVLVLGQAFKGSLSADDVTGALKRGATAAGVEVVAQMGSDGGDGLLEALAPVLTDTSSADVTGPLGSVLHASIGWLDGHVAVIESRMACGLSVLTPQEHAPLGTTTRGVGELVQAAAGVGAQVIYVGLGGSATMDGGLGMARAIGWDASDRLAQPLEEGGGALLRLATLSPGPALAPSVVGLYDVRNPLLGPDGARVYARQKGARPEDEERLHGGLEQLVAVLGASELAEREGAGAAGGLGFGILAFADGQLEPGAPWVLNQLGFDRALASVVGIVVAEGAFDATSLEGKLTGEAMARAVARRCPIVLVAPTATDVPDGVIVESGGGHWGAEDIQQRTKRGVGTMLRLLGST